MTAAAAVMALEARLVWRAGYLPATLVVTAILYGLITVAPDDLLVGAPRLLAAIVAVDVATAPAMLAAFSLIADRSEGATATLSVAPIPRAPILAARFATVVTVCALQMLALGLLAYDGALAVAPFVAGLTLLAAQSAAVGALIAARWDAVFAALPPLIGAVFTLSAPAFATLFDWRVAAFDALPGAGPVALLAAALDGAAGAPWAWAAAAAWAAALLLLAFRAALRGSP